MFSLRYHEFDFSEEQDRVARDGKDVPDDNGKESVYYSIREPEKSSADKHDGKYQANITGAAVFKDFNDLRYNTKSSKKTSQKSKNFTSRQVSPPKYTNS